MRMPRGISRSIVVAAFGAATLVGTTQATAAAVESPATSVEQDATGVDASTQQDLASANRTKEERIALYRTKEE